MDYDVTIAEADAAAPDLQRYLPEVAGEFVSEEDAIEYLRTLWNIMCAFIDLGWGVDSIHLVLPELVKTSSPGSLQELTFPEHQTIARQASVAFAMPPVSEES